MPRVKTTKIRIVCLLNIILACLTVFARGLAPIMVARSEMGIIKIGTFKTIRRYEIRVKKTKPTIPPMSILSTVKLYIITV